MRKLTPRDLWPNAVYEKARDEYRAKLIALKRPRRVALGDRVTLVFENRETVRFQVQEMLRAEGIASPEGIQAELDAYNSLVPGDGELSATLMIDIGEEAEIRDLLERLVGIEETLVLAAGGREVRARFEEGRSDGSRVSAVQFVRFPLGPEDLRALLEASEAKLALRHPSYRAEAALRGETLAALKADLKA